MKANKALPGPNTQESERASPALAKKGDKISRKELDELKSKVGNLATKHMGHSIRILKRWLKETNT